MTPHYLRVLRTPLEMTMRLIVTILLMLAGAVQAQSLSNAQLLAFKSAIQADAPSMTCIQQGNLQCVADLFNTSSSVIVWRTVLSRHEILTGTSESGTTFTWAGGAYITRSQGERDAFREMFNSTGNVDPSLPSIKAAFTDIFSGSGGLSNRTHISALSKRTATRFEAVFATGTGTAQSPASLGKYPTGEYVQGAIGFQVVAEALAAQ